MDVEMIDRHVAISAALTLLLMLGVTEVTWEESGRPQSEWKTRCEPYGRISFPTSCLQFVARVVCSDFLMNTPVHFKDETLLEPNGLVLLTEDVVIQDKATYFNFKNEAVLEPKGLVPLADTIVIPDMAVIVPQQNGPVTILDHGGFPFRLSFNRLLGTLLHVWFLFHLAWVNTSWRSYNWLGKVLLIVAWIYAAYKMLLTLGTIVCFFMNQ